MSKCLIIPDVHGRKFWTSACNNIDEYEKVIFLGDYVDPYPFEGITVEEAIENFKEIIEFKNNNPEKVVLLLGNHDFPYAFEEYLHMSSYHSRHSAIHHYDIAELFNKTPHIFQLSYSYDGILFTHAGVESTWFDNVLKCKETDPEKISEVLNTLPYNRQGLDKLYYITSRRGGYDGCGSCIWSDIFDMIYDNDKEQEETNPSIVHEIKQVFGHSLQAFYDKDKNIIYGNAVEFGNCKMLDTANAYVLDTREFKVTKL